MKLGKWGSVVVFVAVLFVLARCGNKTSGPASGTFGHVYQTIKTSNCVECHNPTGAAKKDSGVDLDFTTQATAFAGLSANVVTGATSKTICLNVKLVTAGDVTKSYVAAVLISDYNKDNFGGKAGCKPYTVHLQDTNLRADEKTSLVNWITAGAKND